MNIITISREFGSGGRELGRRLADELGYDYYDGEIIAAIAKNSGLDASYVETALEDHGWQAIPMTVHRTFASPMVMQAPRSVCCWSRRRSSRRSARRARTASWWAATPTCC